MKILERKLDKSTLEVSSIGIGMNFGHSAPADKKEMITLIRSAIERDVTFYDMAEVYGPTRNEELLGETLALFYQSTRRPLPGAY